MGGSGGNVLEQTTNILGEGLVDTLTSGFSERIRRGKRDREDYGKRQEAAAKEAETVRATQDEIKKSQYASKAEEIKKRASAANAGGREGSVLGSAGLAANSGNRYKTLLGE